MHARLCQQKANKRATNNKNKVKRNFTCTKRCLTIQIVSRYFSKNQKDCMPCLAVNFFNYENCHIISIRNAQIRISRSVNKTFHKQIQTRPRTYCKWIHFFLSFVRMYFFFHLIDFIYSSVQFCTHNRLRHDCSPFLQYQ